MRAGLFYFYPLTYRINLFQGQGHEILLALNMARPLENSMKTAIAIIALALLAGCNKNPADQAAHDIKAMGAQRDKAKEALSKLEESQKAVKAEADKAGDAEPAKN
jgi:hypothetical protein